MMPGIGDLLNLGKVKSVGRKIAVGFAAEFHHDDIIAGLREILKDYTREDIRKLIDDNELWPVFDNQIIGISKYQSDFALFPPGKIADWLEEARPDLATEIQVWGEKGAIWFCNNLVSLKQKASNLETAQGTVEEEGEKEAEVIQFAGVVCKSCSKKFMLEKDEVDSIKNCPFCGVKVEE